MFSRGSNETNEQDNAYEEYVLSNGLIMSKLNNIHRTLLIIMETRLGDYTTYKTT